MVKKADKHISINILCFFYSNMIYQVCYKHFLIETNLLHKNFYKIQKKSRFLLCNP